MTVSGHARVGALGHAKRPNAVMARSAWGDVHLADASVPTVVSRVEVWGFLHALSRAAGRASTTWSTI